MTYKVFYSLLIAAALSLLSPAATAWGPEGHRIIGQAAFELLEPSAREPVMRILGIDDARDAAAALDTACNWPDEVRPTPEWAWSAPLHYVNVPRHAREYERERDCPDGRCVTEGVLHYAAVLSRPVPEAERRWQALAFLCHLVGDLHQPLHAGFRDDRGANRVEIEYRGEDWNLHEWWDSVLVRARLGDERERVAAAVAAGRPLAAAPWTPDDVRDWTGESHGLAIDVAYPPSAVIDEAFAARAWERVEIQWGLAAGRLAGILNTLFDESEHSAATPATQTGTIEEKG